MHTLDISSSFFLTKNSLNIMFLLELSLYFLLTFHHPSYTSINNAIIFYALKISED